MKPHLVLIPSFPTNSDMLKGLIGFLEDTFTVHCLDLPGFTPGIPLTKRMSATDYLTSLEERIRALPIKSYFLGGISFGFLLACRLPPDERCKGLFAIEPCMGATTLRIGRAKRFACRIGTKSMLATRLERAIWRRTAMGRMLERNVCPSAWVDRTLHDIDPHAFFSCLDMIVSTPATAPPPLPTVAILNERDDVIDNARVLALLPDAKIIWVKGEHYPADLSEAYFRSIVTPAQIAAARRHLLRRATTRRTRRGSARGSCPRRNGSQAR